MMQIPRESSLVLIAIEKCLYLNKRGHTMKYSIQQNINDF